MRFALIDAEKAEFPARTMCRVLDVSESGFFSLYRTRFLGHKFVSRGGPD